MPTTVAEPKTYCTYYVHSPHDGGWYAQQDATDGSGVTRTTWRTYSSKEKAVASVESGKAKWLKWT
jgi:hypothetical protein